MGRLIGFRRHGPRLLSGSCTTVLFDAFGTLVTLDAPAPLLRALLEERLGVQVTEAQAADALGAEVAYYRSHMQEGVDTERVARLHAHCAEVLRRALPAEPALSAAEPALMTEILLDALRFKVFAEVPQVLERLRHAGLRLVVASNWDASLDGVLDRAGLLGLLDGVVTSAAVGYAKPDPRLLQSALLLAGSEAGEAVHVGDGFREDVGAAFGAGIRPVLLSRDGRAGEVEYGDDEPLLPELLVIRTLAELPAVLGLAPQDTRK
jgi:putative hydrolase of the HAD superfamily